MKRAFAAALAATFLALGGQAALAQQIPAPVVKKPLVESPERVLFIGNSLMYYNGGLQTHLHRMALDIDPKLAKIKDGFRSVHVTSSGLGPYPPEFLSTPGNLGVKEPFQMVVLAGSAKDPMEPATREVYRKKVLEWDASMKKIGGRVALIWLAPFSKPKWDEAMYRANGEMVVGTANEIGAQVIPIGPAFVEATRLRPGMKLQVDYDGYHPTLAGQYLSSAVVFATLYGRSPEGAPYNYFGALDKDTTAFLQKVASDTVKKFFQ